MASLEIHTGDRCVVYQILEDELTVGELTNRGYYLGSNVSYNVRKMVENGYLIQERSPHDRRSFHVRAAEKGVDIYRAVSGLFDRHAEQMAQNNVSEESLEVANNALRTLQQFWSVPGHFAGRIGSAA